jgi:hypothetical protein
MGHCHTAFRAKAPTKALTGPRLIGFVFHLLLGEDVQDDLFPFGPGWMHLREEPADVPCDFRVSFAFERIMNGIPALLHLATGRDRVALPGSG